MTLIIIVVVCLAVFWPGPKSAAKPISHPASWLRTLFAHKRPKFSTIERFISQSFCGLTNNGENQGGGLMLIPAHNRPLPKAYGSQTSSDDAGQQKWLPSCLQRSKSLSPRVGGARPDLWNEITQEMMESSFSPFPFLPAPTSATSNAPNSTSTANVLSCFNYGVTMLVDAIAIGCVMVMVMVI